MKASLLISACLFFAANKSFGQQTTSAQYNENNYSLIGQSPDPDNSDKRYLKLYQYNGDTSYTLKKVYLDSACTQLNSKSFLKSGQLNGPFFIYRGTQTVLEGAYKNGKWDGERKTYVNEQLRSKAYFTEGLKTGIWEEYNTQGGVMKRTTFDSTGNILSDIKY